MMIAASAGVADSGMVVVVAVVVKLIIGSLSNDGGDGNKNGKKQWVQID